MLIIKGISKNPCFINGDRENVVDVKFKDGSFEGSISWENLWKVIKRRTSDPSPSRDAGGATKQTT